MLSSTQFRVLSIILRILTLVLGLVTLGLSAVTYSKPFPDPSRPFPDEETGEAMLSKISDPDTCCPLLQNAKDEDERTKIASEDKSCRFFKHVWQDELVLGMICIILILSILGFLIFIAVICISALADKKFFKIIDIGFHICAAIFLLALGILWLISSSERSFDMSQWDSYRDADADAECKANLNDGSEKYGAKNLILRNYKSDEEFEAVCEVEATASQGGDGKYAIVIINGVLVLINAVVYVAIAVLVIWWRKAENSAKVKPEKDAKPKPPSKLSEVEDNDELLDLDLEHDALPEENLTSKSEKPAAKQKFLKPEQKPSKQKSQRKISKRENSKPEQKSTEEKSRKHKKKGKKLKGPDAEEPSSGLSII